jgi:protein PhnA
MNLNPCEICSSESPTQNYEVPQNSGTSFENTVFVCQTCLDQIEDPKKIDANHWRCLKESIWADNPAVKVIAWRMLTQLSYEDWAQNLLLQFDLDEDLLEWAKSDGQEKTESGVSLEPKDSNGTVLKAGDSVTLIKDLDVKGAGFTAKRGTLVKNIVLTGDPALIEGKVNGSLIVLKTCFLKKSV